MATWKADLLDFAPGAPGITPRWTSSARSGVGTALSRKSPLWFTLSHGILNEIYYPRVDNACTPFRIGDHRAAGLFLGRKVRLRKHDRPSRGWRAGIPGNQ